MRLQNERSVYLKIALMLAGLKVILKEMSSPVNRTPNN